MLLDLRAPGPKAAELGAFVENGGGLFVAMGDDVDPDRYDAEVKGLLPAPLHVVKTAAERGAPGAEGKAARLVEIDWDHPALLVFTGQAREGLESVRAWRYMLLRPGAKEGGARVLARYDDGAPALVEARRGRGKVMLYASTLDPEWSDWTIRTSFLPAMQRIAAWLAGSLDERRSAPGVEDWLHVTYSTWAELLQRLNLPSDEDTVLMGSIEPRDLLERAARAIRFPYEPTGTEWPEAIVQEELRIRPFLTQLVACASEGISRGWKVVWS